MTRQEDDNRTGEACIGQTHSSRSLPIILVATLSTPDAPASTASSGGHSAEPRRNVRAIPSEALTTLDDSHGSVRQRLITLRDELLADEAAHGRLHDTRGLRAYMDTQTGATAVHSTGIALEDVHVAAGNDSALAETVGIGATTRPNLIAPHLSRQAVGWSGRPQPAGYRLHDEGRLRLTVSHDPDITARWSSRSHLVETWYWKYEMPEHRESEAFTPSYRKDSDFWAYARRGTAASADASYRLLDLTIRSRPWAGTAHRIRSYIDILPVATLMNCPTGTTLGFNYAGLGVSIPVTTCGRVQQVNNISHPLEFGTDWNGSTSNRVSIESLASIRSRAGQEPVMADYIWAEFRMCAAWCPPSEYVRWDDSGW